MGKLDGSESPRRILLVRSTLEVADLLVTLREAGYAVAVADSGADGMAQIPIFQPDLVLAEWPVPTDPAVQQWLAGGQFPDLALVLLVHQPATLHGPAMPPGVRAEIIDWPAAPRLLLATLRMQLQQQTLHRSLQAAHSRCVELLNLQQDATLIVDRSGTIVVANEAAAALFQQPAALLVGTRCPFSVDQEGEREIELPLPGGRSATMDLHIAPFIWEEDAAWCVVLRDLTLYRQTVSSLKTTRNWQRQTLQALDRGILGLDAQGQIRFANPTAVALLGWREDDLIGRDGHETVHVDPAARTADDRAECLIHQAYAGQTQHVAQDRFFRQDGTSFPVAYTASPVRDDNGTVTGVLVNFQDLSEQLLTEEVLSERNRLLQMLSRCNEVLSRSDSEGDLLTKICEIAVHLGGFRFAWVGYAQQDDEQLILPQACAGQQIDYLAQNRFTWSENDPDGQRAPGLAIRSGEAVVIPDLDAEIPFQPWLASARSNHFMGKISLPLKDRAQTFGVLSLYVDEPRRFQEEELQVLRELAGNLAYGISRFRLQAEQKRIERAVLKVATSVSFAGDRFFDHLVANMTDALGAQAGFIARLLPHQPNRAQVIAGIAAGDRVAPYDFALPGTLCEQLREREEWVVTDRIAELYPDDPTLATLDVQGYAGRRLVDGSGQWIGCLFLLYREPLRSADFVSPALQIVAARVTAELELEESARLQQEQAALLSSAQHIGRMGSWSMDLTSGRLRWSEETCRIFGIAPVEFDGSFAQFSGFVLKEDWPNLEAAYARISEEVPFLEVEYRIRRPDGEVRWLSERGSGLFDAAGVPILRTGMVMDITDQWQAREQLAQSVSLLRIAGHVARIGGWMIDGATDQIALSDEACAIHDLPFGARPALAEVRSHFAPADRATVDRAAEACITAGIPYDLELPMVTAKNRRIWVRLIGEPRRNGDGQIVGIQGALQDITEQKQVAEILRHQEKLLSIAGRIARIGGWTMEMPSQQIYWSNEIFDILEFPRGAPPSLDTILALYPEPGRSRIVQALADCTHEGMSFDLEVQVRTARQRLTWVRVSGEADRGSDGAIIAIQGAFQDISDQKAAAAEIQGLGERLLDTLENITDAFIALDRDWHFTYLNREAERLLQRERHSLLGRNVWAEFPPAVDSTFDREYRRALSENKTVEFEEFYAPLNAWIGVRAYPTSDGLAVYLRDVTQQHAAEAQLRLLEAAVARLNDVVLITAADTLDEPGPRIVFVNDAFERRMGYPRAEVLGRSPRFLQGPKTQRAELDRIRHALQAWQPVRAELINYTRGGEEVYLDLDIVPLTDAAGQVTHWVSVERDVTERRLLEDQLKQSQRLEAVGQLTGGVAHDFNNLLTVILGNAELLTEQMDAMPKWKMLTEMIVNAAQRGADLTQRLLAFARRQALDPDIVDVNALVADMLPLLHRSLGEHVEVSFTPEAPLRRALVDTAQLESSILNLCLNARDAMQSGGRLTIETANVYLDDDYVAHHSDVQVGRYVLLAVSDTGSGIAAEHLQRVFEPFFTTKEKGKGTGLGLAMVYGFAKQTGGHVSVYSEPGQGTTVKLYLPGAEGDAERVHETRQNAEASGGTESILLVEDDVLVRQYARDQLKMLGYRVIDAINAQQALEIIRGQESIDLLFTDVVMPGMSGRQLADEAKKVRPSLKVLFTSGYTENAIVHQGRLDPGVVLLSKPYRRAALAQKIREALDRNDT